MFTKAKQKKFYEAADKKRSNTNFSVKYEGEKNYLLALDKLSFNSSMVSKNLTFISQFYFQFAVDVSINIAHSRAVINSFPSRY